MPKVPSNDVQRRRDQLGKNLKAQRKVADKTQEAVAIDANLDRSFYVDVENGHHSPSVDRLFAIADALGVPASRLLDGIR